MFYRFFTQSVHEYLTFFKSDENTAADMFGVGRGPQAASVLNLSLFNPTTI